VRACVLAGWLSVVLAAQLVLAGPASAHAELVTTDPANGQRLEQSPEELTLQFTEPVGLVDGGMRLLATDTGARVSLPEPVADGRTVRFPLTDPLPRGGYLFSWRVVSTDSHPIAGAVSFGVGEAVEAATARPSSTWSWPVVLVRWAGYLAFAVVTGLVAVVGLCWPAGRESPGAARVVRTGAVVAALLSLLALLLQGPYLTGEPVTRLLSREQLAATAHTATGAWLQIRIFLYLAVLGILWAPDALEVRSNRLLAGGGVAAVALTFAGTSHAAAAGAVPEILADAVHVLAAGLWVGGLLAIPLLALGSGPKPQLQAFLGFSRVAMAAVVVLVLSGTISAVLRLDAVAQLWETRYGLVLLAKLALVALALAGAAASRRLLGRGVAPWRPVRFEAAVTVVVLAASAALNLTPPPTTSVEGAADGMAPGPASTVTVSLGDGRSAELRFEPRGPHHRVRLMAYAEDGDRLVLRTAELEVALPAQDLGPLDVPLRRDRPAAWTGRVTFPVAGSWALTLSVEDQSLAGVVTSGVLQVG
jgi:copper transport protein